MLLLSMVGPDGRFDLNMWPHGMWGCLLQYVISGNGSCFTVAVMNQYTVPLEWNGECNKL